MEETAGDGEDSSGSPAIYTKMTESKKDWLGLTAGEETNAHREKCAWGNRGQQTYSE